MENTTKKPIKITSRQLMIIIVVVAVIAVVIYGITGKKSGNTAAPKSTLPITEENLINFWERKDGEKICRLGFEYGNEFFYSEFPSESTVTPELTVANATYKITADGLIIMTYEIDLENHTDTYNISLTEDSLTLTAVKGGGTLLAGKYTPEDSGTTGSDGSNVSQAAENSQPAASTEKSANGNPSNAAGTTQPGQSAQGQGGGSAAGSSRSAGGGQTAQPVSDNWKQLYIDYVNSLGDDWYYNIFYLDSDRVPELYIQGKSEYLGAKILTVSGGTLVFKELSSTYTEAICSKGLLLSSGGHMGYYFDQVYRLQGGSFVKIFDGEYGVDDNTVYYDESNYKYKADGASVSKSDYDSKKRVAFNDYDSIIIGANMSKSEIIDDISHRA